MIDGYEPGWVHWNTPLVFCAFARTSVSNSWSRTKRLDRSTLRSARHNLCQQLVEASDLDLDLRPEVHVKLLVMFQHFAGQLANDRFDIRVVGINEHECLD